MDIEILKSLMGFKLTEEEANPVLLAEDDLFDGVMECEASLLVKILSLKDDFVSLQVVGYGIMVERGDPLTLAFDESKFWIQVRGLKAEYFTREVARKIVHAFKECEPVELRKDKMGNKFFRVRELLKVSLPIRHMISFKVDPRRLVVYGLWIKALVEKSWLEFKWAEPMDHQVEAALAVQ
ncbi:hypothetical protein LIER_42738 [Lithospermum erythrorhizon]|uniref:Uncharacterized protein n=1 Tax=Lithospermum erythrorhizon TaxID=34254 RepID=A0AAV3NVL8_LITER